MSLTEMIEAVQARLEAILMTVPDNPIYEDHESRSVLNYLQCLKILKEMKERESLMG